MDKVHNIRIHFAHKIVARLSQSFDRKRYEYSAWKSNLKTKKGSDLARVLHELLHGLRDYEHSNYLESPLTSLLGIIG